MFWGWIFSSNFLTREAAGEKSNHFSLRLSGPFYFFNSLISVVKSKIQQLMKIIKIYTIWAAHKLLARTVVVIAGDSLVWVDWCRDPPRKNVPQAGRSHYKTRRLSQINTPFLQLFVFQGLAYRPTDCDQFQTGESCYHPWLDLTAELLQEWLLSL